MNYHNITKDDMLNGDGLRVVLWVAGCFHHCDGCQNPETWNPNGGIIFDDDAFDEIATELQKDYCAGLTLSGGDPLYFAEEEILGICKTIKREFPTKTIWCYTGYTWEKVKDLEVMDYIDVLVDGEFDKTKVDMNYPWAGSTNQRVIDVPKSIKEGGVVLYESN